MTKWVVFHFLAKQTTYSSMISTRTLSSCIAINKNCISYLLMFPPLLLVLLSSWSCILTKYWNVGSRYIGLSVIAQSSIRARWEKWLHRADKGRPLKILQINNNKQHISKSVNVQESNNSSISIEDRAGEWEDEFYPRV